MGFDGLIVTDWAEIFNLHEWHHVAKNDQDAVRIALTKTSVDLSMVPYTTSFIKLAKQIVTDHQVLLERIQASTRRMLQLKFSLGLYDRPVPGEGTEILIGGDDGRTAALSLARESIILLQNNDHVLPMDRTRRVFLTGPTADDIGNLCGGWTIKWQGASGNSLFPRGVSIKEGVESILATSTNLNHFNGLRVDGTISSTDMDKAKSLASQADYTVIALGEGPYAEKPGDIDDLSLPIGQVEYVRALAATGTKVIVVLVSGRPRLLRDLPELAHAVVFALLPGEVGGQAVSEILYGSINPSGRLPITYPKDPANVAIPYNHRVSSRCGSKPCEMQWSFGYGLSFTTFEYSNLTLSKTVTSGKEGEVIEVSITVNNTGTRPGLETVMLFLTQPYREISVPEVKQLKRFSKVYLEAAEQRVVTFKLSWEDWGVYDPHIGQGFKRIAEDSDFIVAIKPETVCDSQPALSPLCAKFTVMSEAT